MYFISYSRRQFYYTEYLVHTLETNGIKVWFDVQELAIGRDWQSDLNYGLSTCHGLILIASEASLGSPYVGYEWKLAIERGIPIYVVVFEPVILPAELEEVSRAVIHYQTALTELVHCIRGEFTSLPTQLPSKWRYFAWVPSDVILVFATLLVSAIYHIVGAFGVDWVGIVSRSMLQIIFVSLSVFILYQAWQFIKRTFSFTNLINSLVLFNVLGFISYTQIIFPTPARVDITVYLLTLILLPLTFYVLYLTVRSREILWWVTTGEAPEILRLRHYPQLSSLKQHFNHIQSSKPIRFAIHSYPSDEPLAKHIVTMLVRSGHEHVTDDIDYHLVVVSNYTDPVRLETFIKKIEHFIAIVTHSVNVPASLEVLKRYQWIDYRTQSSIQLRGLIEFFNQGTEADSTKLLNNVPESMGRIVIPRIIQLIVLVLRIIAAIYIVTGTLIGLVALVGLPNGHLLAFAGVLIGIAVLWLVSQVVQRRITKQRFLIFTVIEFSLALIVLPEISAITGVFSLLIVGGTLRLWKQLYWFPQSSYRLTDSISSINPVHVWIANALTILLGIWAVLFVPGVEATGLLELVAFEVGITGYQQSNLGGISFNVPNYFQLTSKPTTPDHLDDIGRAIWQGRSATGISAENAITIRVLQYSPQLISDGSIVTSTVCGMPDIPTNDPVETISFYISKDFLSLREQIYNHCKTLLVRMGSFSESPLNPLPPLEPEREVNNVLSESLVTENNIPITRFRYDLVSENRLNHEWLITWQSVYSNYIVHITGQKAAIEWHASQINHLIESLLVDENFRIPEDYLQIEDIIFHLPYAKSIRSMNQILQTNIIGRGTVEPLHTRYRDDLLEHHSQTYAFQGTNVTLGLYTLAPDSEYDNSEALVNGIRNYTMQYPIVEATPDYNSLWSLQESGSGIIRNEDGDFSFTPEMTEQLVYVQRRANLQFRIESLATGNLYDGTEYHQIKVISSYPFVSNTSVDNIILFDHHNVTYILWTDGAVEFINRVRDSIHFVENNK